MKIVIRAPNWIGDSVLALSAIESLHQNLPEAQIWIATNEWVKDLFLSHDLIKGIIPLPGANSIKSLKDSAKEIKGFHFDAGLLFTNSFISAFLFYLARIPQRWGYSRDGRGFLLTKRVSPRNLQNSIHQLDYYMGLISGLGYKTFPAQLSFPLTQEEQKEARKKLLSCDVNFQHPIIILNPGASYGPAKRWPAEKFAELGSLLQERNRATVLITGARNERGLAESVSSLMIKKPINLSGQTSLRTLGGLISQSNLFVTNDSGPMHIANALKTPVIAVFGPTDPSVTGPYQEPSAVIKKDVSCWPCAYRECPFDHRCMVNISPEEVHQACQRFLR
jgi:heptosyltransferase-2